MGRRQTPPKASPGGQQEGFGLGGRNIHEMETQVMEFEDNEEQGSPSVGSASSPAAACHERKTRSGRSIVENISMKTRKKSSTPKSKPKNERKSTKSPRQSTYQSRASSKESPKLGGEKLCDPSNSESKNGDRHSTEKNDSKDYEEDTNSNGETVPLAAFMAKLDASPSSSSSTIAKDKTTIVPECSTTPKQESVDCPANTTTSVAIEGTSGKLRSSVADAEGMALARGYRKSLENTEEFALNYITQEFHHPVITCFRELNRSDITTIVGNSKFKKSCNSLEQSIVYLGLIDLLATVNHNPVYGETETSHMTKNVSTVVQKILLEFKNIMGTWALSCNDQLSGRYSLIIKYIRNLVPMFKKAGFDVELGNILDCIEKEVSRHKMNQEKIKAMSNTTPSRNSENSAEKLLATDSQDGENRSALNEIILNVNLKVKPDESEDEDEVAVLKDDTTLKIFGKPLKGSPRSTDLNKKKSRKPKSNVDSRGNESFKSPTVQKKQNTPKSNSTTSKGTTLPQPKTLSKFYESAGSPKLSANKSENSTGKTPPVKRSANDELNDVTKRRKIEDRDNKTNRNVGGKSTIASFFPSVPNAAGSPSNPVKTDKPTINAFALMMSKSREIAQKKKTSKVNALPVPSLKVDAVKS